jgi:hypothetical protein
MRVWPERSLKVVVGVVLLLVLLLLVEGALYLIRGPREWADAHGRVQLGMTIQQVDDIFAPLNPNNRSEGPPSCSGSEAAAGAKSCIQYCTGDRLWHYRIYFDEDGRVINKWHYWD